MPPCFADSVPIPLATPLWRDLPHHAVAVITAAFRCAVHVSRAVEDHVAEGIESVAVLEVMQVGVNPSAVGGRELKHSAFAMSAALGRGAVHVSGCVERGGIPGAVESAEAEEKVQRPTTIGRS